MDDSRFIINDRKILRKIDSDAVKASGLGLLGSLLVFISISFMSDLFDSHIRTAVICLVVLGISIFFRLILIARFESIYARGPRRWRNLFYASLLIHAVIWSAFQVALLHYYNVSSYFFIAALYTVGISTVFAKNWMASIRIARIYLAITFLPSSLFLLSLQSLDSLFLAALLLVFYLGMDRLTTRQYQTFWRAMSRSYELRERNRDLEVLQNQQKDKKGVSSDMMQAIAQEIRTPVSSILGILSLLAETKLKKEQKEYLELAAHSGELLISFMDDLLDFSKLNSGKFAVKQEVFNLLEQLEETAEVVANVTEKRNIELNVIYDPQMPLKARGDGARISQVIISLVVIATKREGLKSLLVEADFIRDEGSSGNLEIKVCDPGLDAVNPRVKALFEGGVEGLNQQRDPQHIGLLISFQALQAMGGSIAVHSSQALGTIYQLSVPLLGATLPGLVDRLTAKTKGKLAVVVTRSEPAFTAIQQELQLLDMIVERTACSELCSLSQEPPTILMIALDSQDEVDFLADCLRLALDKKCLIIVLADLNQRVGYELIEKLRDAGGLVLGRPLSRTGLHRALKRHWQIGTKPPSSLDSTIHPDIARDRHHLILLAEDNPVNQVVLKGMLEHLGYHVRVVDDGKQALQACQQGLFELILMDSNMPIMDGLEATSLIRESGDTTTASIPIIGLIRKTGNQEETHCLTAGMDDFLTKPISLEDLQAKLRRWLGAARQDSIDEGIILPNKD